MKNGIRICFAPLVIALASAGIASAETIDLNKEIVKRLDKNGKLKALYKAKTGRDLPATIAASAIYTGQVGGKGLKLSLPNVIPSHPTVVDQLEVDNCYSETVSQDIAVGGTTVSTQSFENMDQIETGQNFTVSVTYDSPWGVSATASTSLDKRSISMKKQGGSESSEKRWDFHNTIPVPPNKAVTVQLVVTEEKLSSIPYTANFILEGPVKLVYSAGAAGFSWVERRGAALPSNPAPLRIGKQGDYAVYVCRVKNGTSVYFGKTHGDVCYYGIEGIVGGFLIPGARTDAYEYLVGAQAAVALGEPLAQNTFDGGLGGAGTGSSAGNQVCVGDYGGGLQLPGFVSKAGQCVAHHDQTTRLTRSYKVLLDPRVGGVEVDVNNISEHLSESERTLNLRGVFTGVQSVRGKVMMGKARQAACEDNTASAPSSLPGAKSASALGASLKPSAGKRAVVKRSKPGALLSDGQTVGGG
jgi:hypothetical protein